MLVLSCQMKQTVLFHFWYTLLLLCIELFKGNILFSSRKSFLFLFNLRFAFSPKKCVTSQRSILTGRRKWNSVFLHGRLVISLYYSLLNFIIKIIIQIHIWYSHSIGILTWEIFVMAQRWTNFNVCWSNVSLDQGCTFCFLTYQIQ